MHSGKGTSSIVLICWDFCEGPDLIVLPIGVARFAFWFSSNKGFTKRMKLRQIEVRDIFRQKENINLEQEILQMT